MPLVVKLGALAVQEGERCPAPGKGDENHAVIASGLDQDVAEARCKAPADAVGAQQGIDCSKAFAARGIEIVDGFACRMPGASVVGRVALAVHDDDGRLAGYGAARPFDARRRRRKPSQVGLAGVSASAACRQSCRSAGHQSGTRQGAQWKVLPGSLSFVAGAHGSPVWMALTDSGRAQFGARGSNLRLPNSAHASRAALRAC